MPRKRKAWWMMLRGPRGHRGLPGEPGRDGVTLNEAAYQAAHDKAFATTCSTLRMEMDALSRVAGERLVKVESRVAELERKLGGSQK
jgi:hypothetical protein